VKLPEKASRIAEDIRSMRIRAAGLIARSAVEALQAVARDSKANDIESFVDELADSAIAVSLPNGVRYVMHRLNAAKDRVKSVEQMRSVAIAIGARRISDLLTARGKLNQKHQSSIRIMVPRQWLANADLRRFI